MPAAAVDRVPIVATVTVTKVQHDSLLSALSVTGHEVDRAGNFQLCTALSMHVRTILHLIQHTPQIHARIEIPHEGVTVIENIKVPIRLHQWFGGVSALFLQGIRDLAEQFPQQLALTVARA